MPVDLWYIEVAVNNFNSRVYLDIMKSMEELKDGPFSCTYKLNDGMIVDLVTLESEVYVEPVQAKTNLVSK